MHEVRNGSREAAVIRVACSICGKSVAPENLLSDALGVYGPTCGKRRGIPFPTKERKERMARKARVRRSDQPGLFDGVVV